MKRKTGHLYKSLHLLHMTPLDYQAIQCFGKVVIGGGDTDGDTMKNYATL